MFYFFDRYFSSRFQELENYDDYDPVPYQGGYDQQEAYGSIRRADEECGYRRTDYGEDDEEQEVEYGNESNPYGRGPPGPSIYGGHPRPGEVYGGGRDRTGRRNDEAQPDEGVETGYGRRHPSYGKESGYLKPRPAYGEEEESYEEEGHGNRNPRRDYDDEVPEELRYQQSRRVHSDERHEQYHSSYSRTSYGGVPQEEGYGSGYGRTKDDEETEESGYGGGYGRKKKNESEDEGSDGSRGRREKKDSEDEGSDGYSGRRKKKNDDEEDEDENRGYGGYGSRRNDDEEEEEAPKKSWW